MTTIGDKGGGATRAFNEKSQTLKIVILFKKQGFTTQQTLKNNILKKYAANFIILIFIRFWV